jgi:hypothetical protein
MTPDRSARRRLWQRRLRRHRRPVAAALTFAAVLTAVSSLRAGKPEPAPGAASHATASVAALPTGMLAAPVRLADSAVVDLLRPGDVVDVVAADARGRSTVVAASATVLSLPTAVEDPLDGDGLAGSLVVLAVPSATGVALAGAAVLGPLSLLLHP